MTGSTEKGRRRRTEILQAYRDVLVEEGLPGASLGRVAKRAGLPSSNLVYYFENKEEMTVALVDFLLSQYDVAYGEALRKLKDPVERLAGLLHLYFTPAFQDVVDNRAFYGCFCLSLYLPRVRRRFEELFDRSMALLRDTLAESMDGGALPRGDVDALASAIYAMEEGYGVLSAWNPDAKASLEMGRRLEAQARSMVGLDQS